MKREIVNRTWKIREASVPDAEAQKEAAKLKDWLSEQAQAYQFETLLVHADDGVIWGIMKDKKLHLSGDYGPISPSLSPLTFRECRLFGPAGELHLWHEGGSWQARLIEDGPESEQGKPTLDEEQILWGTKPDEVYDGLFTAVSDGSQENRHAPPLALSEDDFGPSGRYRPLRLRVRHYLASDDETGLAHIHLSRLVALRAVSPQEKEKNT